VAGEKGIRVALLALALVATLQDVPAPQSEAGTTRVKPRSSPNEWVRDRDYPRSELDKRAFGLVVFRLEVDVDGRVAACRILNTSGFWDLDERTCRLLIERASFEPARRADGTPIRSSFSSRFFWAHNEADRDAWQILTTEVTRPLETAIKVNRLPSAYKGAPLIRVRFDHKGAPILCKVELTSGHAGIDKAACDQAMAEAVRPPTKAVLRNLPDTRTYRVTFSADAATQ
jgi:TonB family protein